MNDEGFTTCLAQCLATPVEESIATFGSDDDQLVFSLRPQRALVYDCSQRQHTPSHRRKLFARGQRRESLTTY